MGGTKIKEEDSLRTVDGLRGRLLAERLASRNATKEADQLANKLLEMEKQLKEEARSRNRAEKKLEMLIKRLESMDIVQENDKSAKGFADLQENYLQISVWNVFDDDNQMFDDSTTNKKRMESSREEDDEEKSMAMIAIEMPKKKERIDAKVVDASVKEVLQSLKRAKEQIQSSIERRRTSTNMSMIRVG